METVGIDALEEQMKRSSLEEQQGLSLPSPSLFVLPDMNTVIESSRALKELFDLHDNELDLEQVKVARKYVLDHGLPDDLTISTSTLRSKAWKSFLGVPLSTLSIDHYEIKACQSAFDAKIRDDTFRTFKKNADFWSKINESMLLRILNAAAADHGYVQGMNVLLGPFLLVLPEVDAYYCFDKLLSHHIPTYVMKNLDGVHRGSALASKCLAVVDKPLHSHIINKLRDFSVFSIRFIMTLLANTQPLSEVIKLWDAIFAFGSHFGILVFCAYLSQLRERILAEKSGYK
ncbi:hypothetical protein EON65_04540 [archaeon]|nr:MAG: hypothetical protein EON65_04540 [archaeon]